MAETPGYHDDKADYLKRLRRIKGQVRGLQRMVDEDAYCIDILTQVSAVNSALQSVSVGLSRTTSATVSGTRSPPGPRSGTPRWPSGRRRGAARRADRRTSPDPSRPDPRRRRTTT